MKKLLFLIFVLLHGGLTVSADNLKKPELILFSGMTTGAGSLDGPVDIASFGSPEGIAVDSHGNIFISDTGQRERDGNHTIRKITPQGVVSTLAGKSNVHGSKNGKGAAASFNEPRGIVIDTSGNLFVADTDNHMIRKITPDGTVTTFVGNGHLGYKDGVGQQAQLFNPKYLTIDGKNNLYLGHDTYVRKITPDGAISTFSGINDTTVFESVDGLSTTARFVSIYGIAADSRGNIYVTDSRSIRKISPNGSVITLAGSDNGDHKEEEKEVIFKIPGSLTVDKAGNIFVHDKDDTDDDDNDDDNNNNDVIRKITPDGVVTTIAKNIVQGDVDVDRSLALTAAADGNIFIADANNNSILKMTADGKVTTVAGGARYGINYKAGQRNPEIHTRASIACGPHETVYIAHHKTIFKINSSGMTEKYDQDFYELGKIIVNANGNIYVTDAPTRSTFSSGGGSGYSLMPKSVKNFFDAISQNRSHYNIYKVADDGKKEKITGKSEDLSRIAFGKDNQMYAANYKSVFKVKPKKLFSADLQFIAGNPNIYEDVSEDGVGKNAKFHIIVEMVVDQFNNIYVVDYNLIKKITPEGVVTTVAGSVEFEIPRNLALDDLGNLYVTESKNNIVRKIAQDGTVSTFVGKKGTAGFSEGALPGVISNPIGLSVCESSLYILMKDGAVAVVRNIF